MSNNQEIANLTSQETENTFLANNQKVLKELTTFINIVNDSLNIGFIEVNLAQARRTLVEYLQQQLNNSEIQLEVFNFPDPDLQFLRDAIVAELQNISVDPDKKLVLLITGLEKAIGTTEEYPKILVDLNYVRDDFRVSIPHPILFLLPEYALTRLAQYTPDFWAWGRKIFNFRTVQSEIDSIAKQILFIDKDTDNFGLKKKKERIELLLSLVSEYQSQEKTSINSSIFNQLGDIYEVLGDYKKSIKYYQRALALCQKSGDFMGEAISLRNLGFAYYSIEKYQQSMNYYQQSLTIAQDIGDRSIQGSSLGGLGSVNIDLGKCQQSIDYYQQSLTIAQDIGDHEMQGTSLGGLGCAYNNLGRNQESINYSRQALDIALKTNDRISQAMSLNDLGISYNVLEKYKKAIDYYKQSLDIVQELGDRKNQAISLMNLGVSYQNLEKSMEAKTAYQKAKKLFTELGLKKDVARCDRALENLERSE